MELYCNTGFCIAVKNLGWVGSILQYTRLYCREEGSIVLQDCIARGLAGENLYHNTMDCIVTETGQCCIAIQSL